MKSADSLIKTSFSSDLMNLLEKKYKPYNPYVWYKKAIFLTKLEFFHLFNSLYCQDVMKTKWLPQEKQGRRFRSQRQPSHGPRAQGIFKQSLLCF
jgi:hypothetical protein